MKPKIKKNKKAIISILLIVAILVTGAFALLSATDSKTNVFTVGNVKAKLSEEFDTNLDGEINRTDDATEREVYDKSEQGSDETIRMKKDIMPGQKVIKRPYVENTGKNEAWIFVSVGIPTTDSDNVYRDKTTGETKIAGQDVSIPIRAYAIQESYANKTESDDIWNAYFDADKQLAAFGAEETAGAKLSERVPLFEILNEQRWSDITVGGTNDPNGEWSSIGSVYKSVNGYDYYVFGYNTILEAPDNADESIKTSFAFEGVKLSENIGEASPISLNYYEYEGDNDTLNGEVDLTVNSEIPEGYRLVKTEYYMPGATVPTLYYDESLAKTGYAFDWCFMDDLSKSAYSGMTITDDTNLIAAYTDKISPSEDSNEPTVNPTKIYPGSGYLCYAIEEDANGYFATLIGADSSSADYPSEPTTVTVPATLKVVTNSNGAKILENGIVKHGSLDDIAENATIPVKKVQLAEWQWDYNTNEVMDQTAVDLGKIAETLVLSDNIESLGFCGDIYQHNIASGFALKSINVPYACSEITSKAFYSCSNLINVTLPNSLKEINSYAFYNCTSLPKFDTPDSVRFIDASFDGCSSLSEFTIGPKVEYFNGSGLENCLNLKKVHISDLKNFCLIKDMYSGGAAHLFSQTGNTELYFNNNKIISFTVPEGVQKISYGLFAYSKGIEEFNLPDTVIEIDDMAFYSVSDLKTINMGNGVKKIGGNAFSNDVNLANVAWSSNLENIGPSAFSRCENIKNLTLPKKVSIIEGSAFYGNNFSSITIPNSVIEIGEQAFRSEKYQNVVLNIGNGAKKIGDYAFDGMVVTNLSECYLPSDLETIGTGALSSFIINNLHIGAKLQKIGDNSFNVAQNIFVNSDNAAFSSKNGILYNKDFSKLVMYPQDNPTVNLVLPEGLKEISDGIFRNNHILKTILIPSSVINIGAGITESTSIESIIVDSNNAVYDSRNNCNAIVESKANKLIAGCKNTVIPNNVEIIGTRALNNVGISTINLHTGIKKIEADGVSAVYVNIPSIEAWLNIVGDDSYSYPVDTISGTLCINNEPITNVVIPGSVTAIKDYAFKSQNQIESITIKNGVTSIGSYAFSGTSIKSLTIPASISEIGSTIFEGCYNLSTVNFENGIKHVNGSMFFSSYVEEITIPPSVSSISDNLWGLNFAAEENGKICVVNVEDLASFAKISLLFPQGELNSLILKHNGATVTDLVIDNSITSIGQAFNGFQSIKSITIPTSVKSISEYAFNCCSNLTSITYEGTTAQWEQMNIPPTSLPAGITITCTNGTLTTA